MRGVIRRVRACIRFFKNCDTAVLGAASGAMCQAMGRNFRVPRSTVMKGLPTSVFRFFRGLGGSSVSCRRFGGLRQDARCERFSGA